MPLVTIDVRCGRPLSELDAVADTVDEAMVEHVEVPGATAATETLAGEEDCPRSSFFATGVRIQIRAKGFLCGSSEFDDQDKLPRLSPAPGVREIVLLRAGRTPTRPMMTRGAAACPGGRRLSPIALRRPDRAPPARPRPAGPTARRRSNRPVGPTAPSRRPILPSSMPGFRRPPRSGPTRVADRGPILPPRPRRPSEGLRQFDECSIGIAAPSRHPAGQESADDAGGAMFVRTAPAAKHRRIRCLLWAPGAAPTLANRCCGEHVGQQDSGAVAQFIGIRHQRCRDLAVDVRRRSLSLPNASGVSNRCSSRSWCR